MNNLVWSQWVFHHDEPEQQKRADKATDKKLTPISIDVENCIGHFKGSKASTYVTSLADCTCVDFARRHLPCKHMYRLAHELHVFDLGSNVTSSSSPVLQKNEAIALIEASLTEDEQKSFRDFCYRCGNDSSATLEPREIAQKFLQFNLAVEVNDVSTLLSYLSMNDIRRFLPPGTKSPRTRVELISLVVSLVKNEEIVLPKEILLPENSLCITLHPTIASLGHTLHRHLCSVFPTENDFMSYFS